MGRRLKVTNPSHLRDPASRGQPLCTLSQVIRYFDNDGHVVVEMHQYLRRDGVLGGKPDPKRLLVGDCMLVFQRNAI